MHVQSDHNWLYCDTDLNLNRYVGRPVQEVWNITDKTDWQLFQELIESSINEKAAKVN